MLAFLLSTLESNEDKEIFTKIYEQYRPLMERTATRILKEPSDIEDAVQNAFVQIICHFDKIYEIPREELPFWIISISTLDYSKKSKDGLHRELGWLCNRIRKCVRLY